MEEITKKQEREAQRELSRFACIDIGIQGACDDHELHPDKAGRLLR